MIGKLEICNMKKEHYESVKRIYQQGIDGGISTFQKKPLEWEEFDRDHLQKCRYIVKCEGNICGWIALSKVSIMDALNGVAEISVYVDNNYMGLGVGTFMLMNMIEEASKYGMWSLQSMILPENARSIALHKKCGFREIGYKEKIAQMPNGVWKNVILFEKRIV